MKSLFPIEQQTTDGVSAIGAKDQADNQPFQRQYQLGRRWIRQNSQHRQRFPKSGVLISGPFCKFIQSLEYMLVPIISFRPHHCPLLLLGDIHNLRMATREPLRFLIAPVFKVMVGLDDGLVYLYDGFHFDGKLWLVPEWLEYKEDRMLVPKRMIRLDDHPHQKTKPTPENPYSYAVSVGLTRDLLAGAPTAGFEILQGNEVPVALLSEELDVREERALLLWAPFSPPSPPPPVG